VRSAFCFEVYFLWFVLMTLCWKGVEMDPGLGGGISGIHEYGSESDSEEGG
jgi:hypothetical protein